MAGGKKKKQHIVVFQDEKGQVLKTAFVPHGQAADPPLVPEKLGEEEHYEILFQGWDQDLTSVESNLVVKASYGKVPKKYLVMYFNENGTILGTETVSYGQEAKAEKEPVKEDTEEFHYRFIGWNADLRKISKDTMAKPMFGKIRRSYPVRFLDEDGSLLKESRILYGRGAMAPPFPEKASDPTYHYRFTGWDKTFDEITGPLDIHAEYESIYQEYPVRIYEEDQLISDQIYHYGDEIVYPELFRKGYTLTWTPEPDRVTGETEIRGSYEFTNYTGKEINDGANVYRIVNPSITKGTVCLLHYEASDRSLSLPAEVLLGDYYYRITEIDAKAFSNCPAMEKLILPDTVSDLHEEALSACWKLKEIHLGKGIRRIGKHAFSENTRLRRIDLESDTIRTVHRAAFERMDAPVTLRMKKPVYEKRFSIFEKGIGSGVVEPVVW